MMMMIRYLPWSCNIGVRNALVIGWAKASEIETS